MREYARLVARLTVLPNNSNAADSSGLRVLGSRLSAAADLSRKKNEREHIKQSLTKTLCKAVKKAIALSL